MYFGHDNGAIMSVLCLICAVIEAVRHRNPTTPQDYTGDSSQGHMPWSCGGVRGRSTLDTVGARLDRLRSSYSGEARTMLRANSAPPGACGPRRATPGRGQEGSRRTPEGAGFGAVPAK